MSRNYAVSREERIENQIKLPLKPMSEIFPSGFEVNEDAKQRFLKQ